MKTDFVLRICLAIFLLCALPLFSQQAYREMEVKNGGTIRGSVIFKGTPPPPEVIPVSKDASVCGNTKSLESLTVGKNGGVKDVIVGLEGITQGKPMVRNVNLTIDQLKCEYQPHILIIPKGANLHIMNSDSILHSVHAYDLSAGSAGQTAPPTLFNIALPLKGMKITKPMNQSELVRLLCDAGHPWMNAYLLVTEHPYFTTTDETGSFTLDHVPPGTYTITIWHEGMGKIEQATRSYRSTGMCKTSRKITVAPGATANVNFTLTLTQGSSPQEALLKAQ